MPRGDESQVLATELERVESKIPILMDRDDTFFSQVEKRPGEIVSSISMRQPLELRPGGKSRSWTSDGGDMGRGDMPLYDKAEINTVELEHVLEWTTRRKYGTDSNKKAVVNAFRRDLVSAMKEFRRFLDSLCMTGGNGVFATITTVTTVGTLNTYTCTTDGFGVRLLRFGQDVNIWDPTLTTLRTSGSEVNISFYDGPNKTFQTLDPSTVGGTAAQIGDLVVLAGPSGRTTPPTSILGIPYHDTSSSLGTWLGFNRATTPEIRANRVSANGPLALSMPRLAINKIGDRLGIMYKKKLFAWMHPCQTAAYEELGQEIQRIDKKPTEEGLDLYFNNSMRLAGAPIKESYSWDKTRIDFLDYDVWGRAEFYPAQWYKDENGNRYFVLRGASGGIAASNLAHIVCSWNLYVNNPAGNSYIDTLDVLSGY